MSTRFDELMKDYTVQDGESKYPVKIGYTETGNEISLDLTQLKHVLISGMSQSGKSTMVRNLLPSLTKYADVAVYTTKDSDFIEFEDTAYNCSDLDMMCSLIRRTVGDVERRNDRLRQARKAKKKLVPCTEKPMVILIDEFQSFQELADQATMLALKRIVREGAGLHVYVYIITQTPNKRVLSDGLRDNIMTDIAFKQRDDYASRMALGTREAQFLELRQCIVRNVDKKYKITRLQS